MKTRWILVFFVFCGIQLTTAQTSTFHFLSPKPNSQLNSRTTTIILRQGSPINASSLDAAQLKVTGSLSGNHLGTLSLSDDGKTLLFHPNDPFTPNETVTVTLKAGINTTTGSDIGPLDYSFAISPVTDQLSASMRAASDAVFSANELGASPAVSSVQTDSVPSDLPKLTVGTSNNPYDGKIFLANQQTTPSKTIGNYLMIFNNDGSVVKYKKLPQSANGFKMESNGDPSYNLKGSGSRIIMDTAFTALDTIQGGNGYKTDGHDFVLLPNGHALVIATDPEPVDMSTIVPGGSPNATVTGLVVQEVDRAQNVVFQWRSWDYLPITASYFDLTQQTVDLLHANAIAVDRDGNILVSIRHYSSIVKIDRETGDVDWILGGKLNQFTFINEHASNSPTYFSYQHDIEVLPNGNITLFDNGTQHSPSYSRGVEYQLDEVNKTATMVWDYRHTPDIYSNAMGSVQRLPNGNTAIGWGIITGQGIPIYTEVHPDLSTALELFFPVGQFCYRALKYDWVSQMPALTVTVNEVLQGNTYAFKTATASTGFSIKFKQLNAFLYPNAVVTRFNYGPPNPTFSDIAPIMDPHYFTIAGAQISSYTGEVHVDLGQFPGIALPQQTVMYARAQSTDPFTPQPTSYDSTKNELIFTTSLFGEFAMGIPQSVKTYPPAAISPAKGEIVDGTASVMLLWGTRGIAGTFRLQIATDSTFANPAADQSNLTTTSFTLRTPANPMKYFWRVNTTNSAGTSEWSPIAYFQTASPFITLTSPNGGEHLLLDSTYIIRWQTNLHDTVNVRLVKGTAVAAVIADSTISGTNAILWQVPGSLQPDTAYRIQITSVNHNAVSALSSASFTIARSGVLAVVDPKLLPATYALEQNFPNPFNPSTMIRYQLPDANHVTVRLFDIMGREVRTLVDERKEAGVYTILLNAADLPSGAYFYRIQAGPFVQTRKLVLVR